LEITGADGVMIGRGALGNPWIFKNDEYEITNQELINTVLRHARLHLERYGERGIVTFRKHLAWYFKGDRIVGIKNVKKLKAELMKINLLEELKKILQTQIQ
jgi:tRNA-dihydrouridine synthase